MRALPLQSVVDELAGTPELSDSPVHTSSQQAKSAGLERARAVSDLLDEAFEVPGTNVRVGLDPILGVLPVAGDTVAALASLYVVVEAYRAEVPGRTLLTMLGLIAVDFVAGSVPVVGPVFDAFWKANSWNVAMFEEHVEETA